MNSIYLPDSIHIIYFDITSDFAHFRDMFTHSYFRTLLAPPRTTVLGIVGAAKGLNEEDTIALSEKLYIGIKILSLSGIAKEIITAINQKKANLTTPIMRSLIVKPVYRIFVGSKDKDIINDILCALENPTYPLYLGISDYIAEIKMISDIYSTNLNTSDTFTCVIPINDIRFTTYIEEGKMVFMPELNNTTYSFKRSPKGRVPDKYVKLLMFYNCKVKLEQLVNVYYIDNEPICLF
ncbi:MAG: hypothetical protein KatS3mg003_1750 [Candidatus Nitrosocaldaceae archaeon]|nr:MAG: hypothetical protein KatS3mg003_1750 [Candidatus Nitrosocaldaceae archaeon]